MSQDQGLNPQLQTQPPNNIVYKGSSSIKQSKRSPKLKLSKYIKSMRYNPKLDPLNSIDGVVATDFEGKIAIFNSKNNYKRTNYGNYCKRNPNNTKYLNETKERSLNSSKYSSTSNLGLKRSIIQDKNIPDNYFSKSGSKYKLKSPRYAKGTIPNKEDDLHNKLTGSFSPENEYSMNFIPPNINIYNSTITVQGMSYQLPRHPSSSRISIKGYKNVSNKVNLNYSFSKSKKIENSSSNNIFKNINRSNSLVKDPSSSASMINRLSYKSSSRDEFINAKRDENTFKIKNRVNDNGYEESKKNEDKNMVFISEEVAQLKNRTMDELKFKKHEETSLDTVKMNFLKYKSKKSIKRENTNLNQDKPGSKSSNNQSFEKNLKEKYGDILLQSKLKIYSDKKGRNKSKKIKSIINEELVKPTINKTKVSLQLSLQENNIKTVDESPQSKSYRENNLKKKLIFKMDLEKNIINKQDEEIHDDTNIKNYQDNTNIKNRYFLEEVIAEGNEKEQDNKIKDHIGTKRPSNKNKSSKSNTKTSKSPNYQRHLSYMMEAQLYKSFVPKAHRAFYIEKRIFLPPKHSKDHKTLILDLDETLVHCELIKPTEYCPDYSQKPSDISIGVKQHKEEIIKHEKGLETKIISFDSVSKNSSRSSTVEHLTVQITFRPYVREFLEYVRTRFEVVIFTASGHSYANAVLNELDPQNSIFSARIYRNQCYPTKEGVSIKDLRIIGNRKIEDIIIVDNSPFSYCLQVNNGIPIVSFYDDPLDKQLSSLIHFLDSLLGSIKICSGIQVQKIIEEYFNLGILYQYYGKNKKEVMNKWIKAAGKVI